MRTPRKSRLASAGLVLILAGAVATACAGPVTPAASASGSEAPSATPSPSATPEAAALEVSIDGVALVDGAGAVMAQADFDDGESVLSLLGDALGTTPTGTPNPDGYPFTFYDWGDVSVSVVDDGPATIWIASAAVGGLDLRTTDGVAVGMTRDEAVALGAVADADEDGDGLPDLLRLEVREAPGTESLTTPGTTGVDFILVILEDDAVVRMISPANDWGDL